MLFCHKSDEVHKKMCEGRRQDLILSSEHINLRSKQAAGRGESGKCQSELLNGHRSSSPAPTKYLLSSENVESG